jgi:hypothetical protein
MYDAMRSWPCVFSATAGAGFWGPRSLSFCLFYGLVYCYSFGLVICCFMLFLLRYSALFCWVF